MPNSAIRTLALLHVHYAVDNALADRSGEPIPDHARLVVWPHDTDEGVTVVAVWSYLPNSTVDDQEAVDLSKDLLLEHTGMETWLNSVTPQVI